MGTDRDVAGKTCLITGASSGVGRATALALAGRGARLLVAGRSEERMRPLIEEATGAGAEPPVFVSLDLASPATVRAAGERLLESGMPLHLLINDAGIAGRRGRTSEGFELTFAVNHLGPFLLTAWLLPLLRASAPARIVNVASNAHYRAKGIDWNRLRRRTSFTTYREYQMSKLANVLFTRHLARRLAGSDVVACAVHPGTVATPIWDAVPRPFRRLVTRNLLSPEQGARPVVECATRTDLRSGAYYTVGGEKPASGPATDDDLAAGLWRRSEAWLEPYLPG